MSNANAIEQLQILYEIAMSVGSSLDLRSMLKNSLSTLLKKLNCSAGGVFFIKHEPITSVSIYDRQDLHFEQVFAIPRNTAYIEAYQEALRRVPTTIDAHKLADFCRKLPLSGRGGVESYFYILEMPDVGLLILTRNGEDLDPNILKSLKPLMHKLASACKACEQNTALRESEMRYRESLDQTQVALTETQMVEEELRISEERLISLHRFQNELLDTAAIWIDMFDASGNITFWNLAAERISGYSREEVLGHAKIWEWLYPDYEYRSQMINTAKIKLQRNERLEDFETTIRCKNGEERIIRWHSNDFFDEEGHTMSMAGFGAGIGIGADITEHKRAEKALKDSKRHLTDIINFLPDPTLVIDKDGRVISWNRAIETMTGVKAEDILGKGDYEYAVPFYGLRRPILIDLVLHPQDEFERNYSNICRKGEILAGESHIMNLNGGESYLFGTAAVLYDYKGNTVGAIESIRDITERKRAESALQKSEESYRLIAENVTDVIWTMGMDLRFTYISPSNAHMTGFDVEESMTLSLEEILTPSSIEVIHRVLADELEMEKRPQKDLSRSRTIELEEYCKDGHVIWVEIKASFLRDQDGQPIGIQGISRDITDRKKSEEELRRSRTELKQRVKERTADLEAKNAEMERFIYTVSHDLRTPLVSISGFLGFLKEDSEKGDINRMEADLRIIGDAVTKMDRLLMDTLELSRIGRVVNPPEDVLFCEIVSEALAQADAQIRSENVKISVGVGLPAVQVDKMRLAEVIVNLVENSVKYMGNQSDPQIMIGHRLDKEETVFFVQDNGMGITPTERDKVFDLFYKVDKKSSGTGAGLAIVKRIIEVHGGRIWIESELGKGCTVCFTLPLAQEYKIS